MARAAATDPMPDTNLPPASKPSGKFPFTRIHPSIQFVVALLVLAYLGLNAWIYFYGTTVFNFSPTLKNVTTSVSVVKKQGFGNLANIKLAPARWSPPPPIGTGKQLFRISGGVKGYPTIEWILFDPIDPAMGATQTLTVKANDANPIKAVFVILHTDNNTDTTYTLQPSSGTLTNGEWKTSFTAKNPYNLTYRATIKVQNQNNLFQMLTVTIR